MEKGRTERKMKVAMMKVLFLLPLLLNCLPNGLHAALHVDDSLYLDLVDSVIVDLSRMGDIDPVLKYIDLKDKQVYHPAEGTQIRVSSQYNARRLPASDYYTIMDLMFEVHAEGHEHHSEKGKPLQRYWEREMGVDADWQLGRMSVELRVSGKGNEHLVKRVSEAVEKRFQPFRESHGLPNPFLANLVVSESEYNGAEIIFNNLLNLSLEERPADRMDLQRAKHADHEEWRLGMAWLGGTSHRFNLELTLMENQPPKEDMGSLREEGSFRFMLIRRERLKISVNVASDENGALALQIAEILERYLTLFE